MEMIELVRSEREELTQVKSNVEEQLMETIVPKDLDDGKGVVVEVRSGTGDGHMWRSHIHVPTIALLLLLLLLF